ncbi:hypothetical protein [Parahaliea mediterranea]|uniref:hypothetical protein n=1 Tax=Parahaliea mediterranea TaxID=651086 RepID=UPI0013004050|nr:hypothetical protein [Parahaliea mediterranea]
MNNKILFSLLLVMALTACGGGSDSNGAIDTPPPPPPPPSPSPSPSPTQGTTYGIGGTGGFLGSNSGTLDVIAALSGSQILRDATQRPATPQELSNLRSIDMSRTSSGIAFNDFQQSANRLLELAGIDSDAPLFVEEDLRYNAGIGQIRGGHAGHEYFTVDGKYLAIANEVSNFYAQYNKGTSFESPASAIDRIVAYHVINLGVVPECCYPLTSLSADEREESDRYFLSLFGFIAYHEFGHYFLYHILDGLRANVEINPAILFSSVNEDDADFISGALLKKSGLDVEIATFGMDLFFFQVAYENGVALSFSHVVGNPQIQLYPSSPIYSSLFNRKEIMRDGYRSY